MHKVYKTANMSVLAPGPAQLWVYLVYRHSLQGALNTIFVSRLLHFWRCYRHYLPKSPKSPQLWLAIIRPMVVRTDRHLSIWSCTEYLAYFYGGYMLVVSIFVYSLLLLPCVCPSFWVFFLFWSFVYSLFLFHARQEIHVLFLFFPSFCYIHAVCDSIILFAALYTAAIHLSAPYSWSMFYLQAWSSLSFLSLSRL